MEEQGSIVLQKRMLLFLFTIIFCVMSASYAINTNYLAKKQDDLVVASASNENDIIKIEHVAYEAAKAVDNEKKISENDNAKTNENKDSVIEKTSENSDVSESNTLEESGVISNRNESLSKNTNPGVVSRKGQRDNTNVNEYNFKYVSYRDLAENNPPAEYSSKIEVSATAYCLCKSCCGKSPSHPSYGVTASGYRIVPGTGAKVIAVDPSIIPLGSNVYIEGLNGAWDYGYATAYDTGSAIKEYKIDLYMDTHSEALSWGRRQVNVYIVD